MSTYELQVCDICGRPIRGETPNGETLYYPHAGVQFNFGFSSRGWMGWGSREDNALVEGEVCKDCFLELQKSVDYCENIVSNLKTKGYKQKENTKKPNIITNLLRLK